MSDYPHVTQVLKSIFGENPFWTDLGRQKGTALHKAINLWAEERLDPKSIDDRIAGRLIAFRLFMAESAYAFGKIWDSKEVLVSKKYRFCGTPDAILKRNYTELILVDWKSGIEKYVDFQLAAYTLLLQEVDGIKVKKACAVELKDNRKYSTRWVKDLKRAQRQWLRLLDVFYIKREYGYV